jgi:hypothetical protein
MSASSLYKTASVLIILFALGHTLGFRRTKGMAGADAVVALMKSVRFTVNGFDRIYWDFYVGFGLFVTVFLLFAAALSWQLGSLPREVLAQIPIATWGLALCFAGVTILSWTRFFVAPGVFSTLVTLCLLAAAWMAGK